MKHRYLQNERIGGLMCGCTLQLIVSTRLSHPTMVWPASVQPCCQILRLWYTLKKIKIASSLNFPLLERRTFPRPSLSHTVAPEPFESIPRIGHAPHRGYPLLRVPGLATRSATPHKHVNMNGQVRDTQRFLPLVSFCGQCYNARI